MKDRTLQILSALIQDFVETASPVASSHLLKNKHFSVSSATVRNEFALLEEVGFIRSPHVSAGKVPTGKGYRFYVDHILPEDHDEKLVCSVFEKYVTSYKLAKSKETLFDVLRLVSHLSGNVAFASVENDKTLYIGLSHVLRSPEFLYDPEKAAQIVEILEGQERFQFMLSSLSLQAKEIKIFIGEENLLEEISSCAIIVSCFELPSAQGFVGILGPMRMKYGFNKALLAQALRFLY